MSPTAARLQGAPNLNRLWADLLVEELVRCGVTCFCLAPGSRSTPLTTAVAAHPAVERVVHYDERGTAFFALGYARATGRPAAWITTSGTAVANGLPAVVEAASDGVPMLLLTADRPPELRDTGANQTVDQVKLFGGYARWFVDLPPPAAAVDPAMVLTTVDQAVHRALRRPGGPVHVNCMFREPLAPTPDGTHVAGRLHALSPWLDEPHPYTTYAAGTSGVSPGSLDAIAERLCTVTHGLVVVGRLSVPGDGEAALHLAEALGWPLLPDVGSQVRLGAGTRTPVIACYDPVLGSEAFAAAHAPEAVLHLGGPVTSNRLQQFLVRHRPQPYVVVHDRPERFDPSHQVTHRLDAAVAPFCAAIEACMSTTAPTASVDSWLSSWQTAAARADHALSYFFAAQKNTSEPLVARYVTEHVPNGHGLVLASSMPVRDVDAFGRPDGPRVRVAANRGASGIDGLVATAAGFCAGLEAPVTLLTGDLALLHDLNSLILLRERPVTVVVLNNDGGGIFHFLPIAAHVDVFEPYFAAPHGLSFESAAALFGLAYARPSTPGAFVEAYREATARPSGSLIEVTTDRAANHRLHRDLLALVAEALNR